MNSLFRHRQGEDRAYPAVQGLQHVGPRLRRCRLQRRHVPLQQRLHRRRNHQSGINPSLFLFVYNLKI